MRTFAQQPKTTQQTASAKLYDTRSSPLWAKPCGELDPSVAAHDRQSCGAADVAG